MKSKGSLWFRVGFLAPAVIFYFVLVLWPLIQAFQLAFFRLSGLSTKKTFVGWENFQTVFKDGVFVRALGHNLTLLVCAVVLVLLIGFPLAMAAQGNGRLAKVLRALYLVPHVISLVVVAILWQFIFNPQIGLVTSGLKGLGFQSIPIWMGDKNTALGTVIVAFSWYALGFGILVLQAGIKGIPPDVNEAAELDGAHGARRFWSIIWPLSWPTRRIVVIQTCIGALNTFALVRLMTNSGPDRASEVVLTYLYERGFQPNSLLGEATTIAILNFFMVLIVTAAIMLLFGRNPVEAKR